MVRGKYERALGEVLSAPRPQPEENAQRRPGEDGDKRSRGRSGACTGAMGAPSIARPGVAAPPGAVAKVSRYLMSSGADSEAEARDRRVARQGSHDRRLPRRRLLGGVEHGPHPRPARAGIGHPQGGARQVRRARRCHRRRVRALLRGRSRQEEDRRRAAAAAEGVRRAAARNGRGPRGRGDRAPSRRGAEAEGAGPAHGLPRDHEGGNPARARGDARDRPQPRRRAGDAAHSRPPLRLRGLAGALEEGDARPLGRAGAIGRHPTRRRARTGAHALRRPPATGTSSAASTPAPSRRGSLPSTAAGWRRAATSAPTGSPAKRSSSWTRSARGSSRAISRGAHSQCGRWRKRPTRGGPWHRSALRRSSRRPSRKLRFTSQTTMRLAQRLYENGYITYMRTDSVALSETAVGRRPRTGGRGLRRGDRPGAAAIVCARGGERPGGSRSDPPGGRHVSHTAGGAGAGARRAGALRADLEADDRLADEGRGRPHGQDQARRDDGGGRGRRVPSRRHGDHVPRLPARLRIGEGRATATTRRSGGCRNSRSARPSKRRRSSPRGTRRPRPPATRRRASSRRWRTTASAARPRTHRSSARSRTAATCSRRGPRSCPRSSPSQ